MAKSSSKVTFNVGANYRLIRRIGEGAYGTVVAAVHKPSGRSVAIKKVKPFEHSLFCLRTLRELKLLKYFSENAVNENLIAILDIVKPDSFEKFNEIYIIQELMETDLHRIIRSQQLSSDHCEYFIYQILRAIKSLHSINIVHRDLKPANILLNANCDLKVCDFGLARSVQPSHSCSVDLLTEYVATRWYRAPEIMLSFKNYTKAIDIWAVGCILAEMLTGKALFPGRDYAHQLDLILNVLGTPKIDEFRSITSKRSRDYIRALPIRKPVPFRDLVPNASTAAIDFLTHTLTFDPKKRLTVDEALVHPYLSAYHDPQDEPVFQPLDGDFFSFDSLKDQLSKEQLKELLFDEVISFVPTI